MCFTVILIPAAGRLAGSLRGSSQSSYALGVLRLTFLPKHHSFSLHTLSRSFPEYRSFSVHTQSYAFRTERCLTSAPVYMLQIRMRMDHVVLPETLRYTLFKKIEDKPHILIIYQIPRRCRAVSDTFDRGLHAEVIHRRPVLTSCKNRDRPEARSCP